MVNFVLRRLCSALAASAISNSAIDMPVLYICIYIYIYIYIYIHIYNTGMSLVDG
jgi:hypothetical protein